jgi:hypothetical protein
MQFKKLILAGLDINELCYGFTTPRPLDPPLVPWSGNHCFKCRGRIIKMLQFLYTSRYSYQATGWTTGVRFPAVVRDFSLLNRFQACSGALPASYTVSTFGWGIAVPFLTSTQNGSEWSASRPQGWNLWYPLGPRASGENRNPIPQLSSS